MAPQTKTRVTTATPKFVVVKCVLLLIGLPLVLHLALWVTHERYGFGPALVLTLLLGMALSVVCRRSARETQPDSLAEQPAQLVNA